MNITRRTTSLPVPSGRICPWLSTAVTMMLSVIIGRKRAAIQCLNPVQVHAAFVVTTSGQCRATKAANHQHRNDQHHRKPARDIEPHDAGKPRQEMAAAGCMHRKKCIGQEVGGPCSPSFGPKGCRSTGQAFKPCSLSAPTRQSQVSGWREFGPNPCGRLVHTTRKPSDVLVEGPDLSQIEVTVRQAPPLLKGVGRAGNREHSGYVAPARLPPFRKTCNADSHQCSVGLTGSLQTVTRLWTRWERRRRAASRPPTATRPNADGAGTCTTRKPKAGFSKVTEPVP